jgi:predicted nucleic acid-binding protein
VKPVLLDSGVIVALLDRCERNHAQCVAAVRDLRRPLVTCEAVVAECCYLLRHLPGAPEAVLENVASGIFQIPFRLPPAADGVLRLMRKYRDIPIDFADACLIHLAGQLHAGDILTLDRDFTVYRWGRNRTFRLLVPAP